MLLKTQLWKALVAQVLQLFPLAMSFPLWNDLSVRQLKGSIYKYVFADEIFSAFVAVAMNSSIGALSRRDKHGRRRMLVAIALCETALAGVLALTNSYRMFFVLRFPAYFVGAGTPSRVHTAILTGWLTDWCADADKVAALSYMSGTASASFALGPLVSGLLLRKGVATATILRGAFCLKLLHPMFLAASLADDRVTTSVDEAFEVPTTVLSQWWEQSMRLRRFLMANHRDLLTIIFVLGAVIGASQRSKSVYMLKEVGIPSEMLAYMSAGTGLGGVALNFMIPRLQRRGASSILLLQLFLALMSAYLFALGVVRNARVLVLLSFIGASGYVADTLVTALMVKCEGSNSELDQAGMLSGLAGLKVIFGLIGPTIIKMCAPFWAGLGWIFLGTALAGAVVQMVFERRRNADWVQLYRTT